MQQDKLIHFLGCFMVCTVLSHIMGVTLAMIITLALGAAKELIYDWALGKGTPEWADFAADAAWVIIALIVSR